MSDEVTIKVLKTPGWEERHAEELMTVSLQGVGYSDAESAYKQAALTFLGEQEIYPWRVLDKTVYVNIGASAEFRDVLIFLSGAGAAAFTGEIAKLVGVGDKAIRQWWQDWALLGIVEETAMPGRFRRRFNPKEVGLK